MRSRSYELPPRNVEFGILASNPTEAHAVLEFLGCHALSCNSNQDSIQKDSSTTGIAGQPPARRPRLPWKVQCVVMVPNDDRTTEHTITTKQTTSSTLLQSTTNHQPSSGTLPFRSLPRLWQPDDMVRDVLAPLLQHQLTIKTLSPSPSVVEIWDVGAGAGRDACYLAETLYATMSCTNNDNNDINGHATTIKEPPFCVVAWDQRYRKETEDECTHFFARRNVTHITDVRHVQVHDTHDGLPEPFRSLLHHHDKTATVSSPMTLPVVCLYSVRFYNRPLWMWLARHGPSYLPNGCIVALSHFGKPTLNAPWPFDHPHVRVL
jgi:hypothetical protein